MSYDIFSKYGLDKIHDSEDCDYKDTSCWKLVKSKSVMDSDGFMTDYAWYTNGDKHIFMFGDMDIVEPDDMYSDWEAETDEQAEEWFDNYHGFDEENDFEEDEFDNTPVGNADFMNEGFDRIYGVKDSSQNKNYKKLTTKQIYE